MGYSFEAESYQNLWDLHKTAGSECPSKFHPLMSQIARIVIPASGRLVEVPRGLFIDNEFVPSVDSKELIECVPVIL